MTLDGSSVCWLLFCAVVAIIVAPLVDNALALLLFVTVAVRNDVDGTRIKGDESDERRVIKLSHAAPIIRTRVVAGRIKW